MAEATPPPVAAPAAGGVDVVTLDECRDYLFVALRAAERFALELKKTTEALNDRKASDEWLEEVADQMAKGELFFGQQAVQWQEMSLRVHTYISTVRDLADEIAIQELKGNTEQPVEGGARYIHPELHRFKLEKQARIIGKYGGSPALGMGRVLPVLPKGEILKATASPAAREIAYSKMEGRDAQYLAQVMQFKKAEVTTSPSAWQSEVASRKGQDFIPQPEPKTPASAPSPPSPVAAELSAKLAQRQQAVTQAEEDAAAEAAASARKARTTGEPQGELAGVIARRQLAKEAEAAAAAAAERAQASVVEGAEAVAPQEEQAWNNPASPFGNELVGALRQRAAAVTASTGAASSSGSTGGGGGGAGGASGSAGGHGAGEEVTSTASPSTPQGGGFAFPRMGNASGTVSTPSSVFPAGGAGGAAGLRRTPGGVAGATPVQAPAVANELAERFARMRAKAEGNGE